MAHKITVLRTEVKVPDGKKYKICELGYKTDDGKVKSMRIFGFGDQKLVFDVAAKATKGDVLEAEFKQNEKGYWEFSNLVSTGSRVEEAAPSTQPAGSTDAGKAVPSRGNWETAEERANRQVLIARQSSLKVAADILIAQGNPTEQGVIDLADRLTNYVLNGSTVKVTGEVE